MNYEKLIFRVYPTISKKKTSKLKISTLERKISNNKKSKLKLSLSQTATSKHQKPISKKDLTFLSQASALLSWLLFFRYYYCLTLLLSMLCPRSSLIQHLFRSFGFDILLLVIFNFDNFNPRSFVFELTSYFLNIECGTVISVTNKVDSKWQCCNLGR